MLEWILFFTLWKEVMPMKFSIKSYCLFILPLTCLLSPTLVQANDCDVAYKDNKSQWSFLNNSCDIGKGLWGHKPKKMAGSYWVQCGYGAKLPSASLSNKVRSLFPQQSFILKESGNYRCLVGTFDTYEEAKKARFLLRGNGLADSFIRQVSSTSKVPQKIASTEKKPVDFSLAIPEDQKLVDKPMKYNKPVPMDKKAVPLQIMTYENIDNTFATNTIAYSFSIGKTRFYIPQNLPAGNQDTPKYIVENNRYWIGTTWQQSNQWCEHFGLRLPTTKELISLARQGQAELMREKWPKEVNYWTSDMTSDNKYRSVNLQTGHLQATNPNAVLYATCVIQ